MCLCLSCHCLLKEAVNPTPDTLSVKGLFMPGVNDKSYEVYGFFQIYAHTYSHRINITSALLESKHDDTKCFSYGILLIRNVYIF